MLVLDYGPIEGRSAGRPSGALYPLAAGSGATLPGYEPFEFFRTPTLLVSPDGRWLAASTNTSRDGGSELALIDLGRWRRSGLDQLHTPGPQSLGAFAWSLDSQRLAGLRYRGAVSAGFPWGLDAGELGVLPLVEAEVGDLDQWNAIELSPDGSRLYVLGHRSAECCGIDVQGDPFLATFDLEAGTEVARVALPAVVIGQRFETVFDHDDEYNILRTPAMVISADGASVYVVHADEDRISVVDLASGSVHTEEIIRPSSAFARLGARVASQFVTRAEAKGGIYRRKEAQLSPDGTQVYVTGVSEVACERTPYFPCVDGRPLGLQVVELETMRLVAEIPGIERIAATPDGARLVGIGWEYDRRGNEDGEGTRVGFGVRIIDTASFDVTAHIAPSVAFGDLAVSPDSRFAYLLSDGPGVDLRAPYECSEACTLLTVVDLVDRAVAATRTFETTLRLVSLAAAPR